jgi:exodeoxyribonuclease VII large subunit
MPTDFFDFREQMRPRRNQPPANTPAPPVQPGPPGVKPLTVSQLTGQISLAIKNGLPASVLVQGELSNFTHHRGSGHFYFTLKDADACIDCVMFRSDASRMKFRPEDGMEIIAGGRVSIYAAKGRYQLYATSLHPLGRGALEVAFQQLRAKLEAAGLFAAGRKKPLPLYPLHIALVTSRQTAALQDMLKVLRRFPWLRLFIYHVPVQGEGSARQIAAAISHLAATARQSRIELILLARGGGSLEDLWEFNEEAVARAIASSAIPVVTGIGHEVDVSIADLVADYHAHTPTEAAQVVTAQWKTVQERISVSASRLQRAVRGVVQEGRQRLLHVERHDIFRRPTDRINLLRQVLDDRQRSLTLALGHRLRRDQARVERLSTRLMECHPRHAIDLRRQKLDGMAAGLRRSINDLHRHRILRLDALEKQLQALSPQRVLARGYSMTIHKKRGTPVRSAGDLRPGDRLISRFTDGSIESTVDDPGQPRLFE